MEIKQAVKMERLVSPFLTQNHSLSSSLSSSSLGFNSETFDNNLSPATTTTTTTATSTSTSTSVGFMELLGLQQDMNSFNPSLFDMVIAGYDQDVSHIITNHHHTSYDDAFTSAPHPAQPTPLSSDSNPESSQVHNNTNLRPTTPNSSSISSASYDDQQLLLLQQQQGTKSKKTKQKRAREARVAFMTKSEVDLLEDGYRWRKYGQKAVKHSPFPRSYYRCTSVSCNVKKRVERSFSDASVVVTTYEGHHTHPCTIMPRGMMAVANFGTGIDATACGYMMPMQMSNNTSLAHHLQMDYVNSSLVPQLNHLGDMSSTNTSTSRSLMSVQDRCRVTPVDVGSIRDNGMLQDIVPPMKNIEQ
ncbi:hypothetical protein RND81_02G002300 [Saponaria officinalis]|uniref:WRKY domain-containing protein n=1 Tax=Saponaria officinalis TaxID=3572 RepID=A0AAW1MLP4_SAPOF